MKLARSIQCAVGVLGLALAGQALAAPISSDGLVTGGTGIATGTGAGNFFLTLSDASQNKYFILNLGQNVLGTVNAPSSWSVTDAALQSFIAASGNAAGIKWNVVGVSNSPGGGSAPYTGIGFATTNQGQSDFGPDSWSNFAAGVANIGNYLFAVNNTGSLNSSNSFAAGSTGAGADPNANEYNGTFAWLQFDNRASGFGASQLFSYVSSGDDPMAESGAAEVIAQLGSIAIDAATGTVSFTAGTTAVPLPAAVWLFGSGLMGLAGVARRRRALAV